MFKQIIIASLLVASAFSTTLFTASSNTFDLTMSKNSATAANSDVVFTYTTVAAAITNSQFSSVVCLNLGSTYALTASTTNTAGFSLELTCTASCTNSAALTTSEYAAYTDIVGTYASGSADVFATTTSATTAYSAGTAATMTSNTTANTATYTWSNQTPANLVSMGLPAQGVKGYYRCWGAIDYTPTKGYISTTAVTITGLTAGKNVTLNGAYQAIGGAIFAISALTLMN